jgi:hypothetical protein
MPMGPKSGGTMDTDSVMEINPQLSMPMDPKNGGFMGTMWQGQDAPENLNLVKNHLAHHKQDGFY